MPKYLPDRYNPQMLTDEGYLETEDILFELTAELESIYGQAYNEMLAKCKKYLAWFVAMDLAKRKRFEAGEIDLDEYKRWRMTNMLTGKNHYQMLDVLSTDLTNVNLIAASVINNYMPEVYAVNTNWTEYSIEKVLQVETSFSLFDESTVERLVRDKPDLLPKASVDIPKDKQWNKNKINSAITQGILQGETIDEIAVRLADVTDMNKNSAVRNAATMTTSAQNGGRVDSYKRAQDMGIKVRHKWCSTIDGHTRPSHRKADGEIVEVGAKFSNGLEYPGDPKGAPSEIWNCRCVSTAVVDKQSVNLSNRNMKPINNWDMSYSEWKEAKGGEPILKAARNVNRDMDMHEEYMSLLGKKVPSRFSDFQKIKYIQPDKWRQMVSDARKARNKKKLKR